MKIVFSTSSNIGGFCVRLFTWSHWSHCDMLFDDCSLIGSVGMSNGCGPAGVQKTSLTARLYFNHVTAYKIVEVKLADEAKARQFAEDQVGKPYDWGGCIGTVLRGAKWNARTKWFCSELIAATCEYAGTPLIHKPARRVTPGMIDRLPVMKTIAPVTYI